jgi:hypothetical protein
LLAHKVPHSFSLEYDFGQGDLLFVVYGLWFMVGMEWRFGLGFPGKGNNKHQTINHKQELHLPG